MFKEIKVVATKSENPFKSNKPFGVKLFIKYYGSDGDEIFSSYDYDIKTFFSPNRHTRINPALFLFETLLGEMYRKEVK